MSLLYGLVGEILLVCSYTECVNSHYKSQLKIEWHICKSPFGICTWNKSAHVGGFCTRAVYIQYCCVFSVDVLVKRLCKYCMGIEVPTQLESQIKGLA